MVDSYLPRVVEDEVGRSLNAMGAVVLEGPRACGKTSTARRFAASEALLDTDANLREAARLDPALVLEGDAPRLIDEWQLIPELWNHVRRAVDDRVAPGQFLLTGSAVPADDQIRHSGAGRLIRIRMRPLSLFESGLSSGRVSLGSLLEGEKPREPDSDVRVPDLVDAVVRGGWPRHVHLPPDAAARAVRAYVDETRRVDLVRVDGVRRDPERVGRLLASLARNVATEVDLTTLAADTGGAEGPLDRDTIRSYLEALGRVMVVEDQPAWSPHLRSRSRLRKAPRRHFVDPSLAVAALGAGRDELLADLQYFGFLFESLVVRDLRVYAQARDGDVLHYRDDSGLEVDAVVRTRDHRWAAFEVKLGAHRIDEGAANLIRFRDRVDTERMQEPGALAVITGTGYAYQRPDGVSVIPIGHLGP